jgi:predicted extracellular nuclease
MARPSLTFATFNLYNLQLPGVAMYHGKTYSDSEYSKKIAWTASVLQRLDADIIGFQELWHPDALKAAFAAANLDSEYTLATKLFNNSIGTAIAVRKEHSITSKVWVKDFPRELVLKKRKSYSNSGVPDYKISVDADYFARPVLRVRIKPKQGSKIAPEITVFVAHFKSKLPIDLDKAEKHKPSIKVHQTAIGAALSTIRRTAEAAALRVLLTKEMKGVDKPVVVMGDLNDTEHSVTNTLITGDPSFRLFLAGRAGNSDTGLYPSSSLQDYRNLRDVNYTHVFKGRHETLDHILVSEQFYDYSKKRKWSFKELRVLNDHLEDSDSFSGDHGVVTSKFVYYPAK